jgi:coenzyme Q-binding protein COQ10
MKRIFTLAAIVCFSFSLLASAQATDPAATPEQVPASASEAASTAAPAPAAVPGPITKKLSASELNRVKKGEIILRSSTASDTSSGAGYAVGLVNATPEKIWKTILDYDKYALFMPRVTHCKRTLRQGNRIDSDFVLDMGIANVRYSIIHTLRSSKNRLTWVLDKTKEADYVTKTTGYWQLEEISPGVTLVEYNVEIDIDIPFIGGLLGGLVKKLTNDDLPNVIGTMKKRIESGNSWKK